MPKQRTVFLLIALFCLGLILAALYMQEVMGLEPCYLCIVQRVFVVTTGVVAALAFFHNPGLLGRRLYAALTAVSAGAGGAFAIRQLWLQSLPEDPVPACGPPADYLLDTFSLTEVIPILLQGDGNCAKVQWTLFGLSIPAWTLLAFSLMTAIAVWQLIRARRA